MLAARFAEPRQQDLVVGLQKDQVTDDAVAAQLLNQTRYLADVGRPITRIEPDYSDPVFLERHGDFIKALAEVNVVEYRV